MATFIFHGGEVGIPSRSNAEFFQQFTGLVEKPMIKIMACYWAKAVSEWSKTLHRDIGLINAQATKKFTVETVANPTELFVKLPTADVLYVAGGEAELIEPFYPLLLPLKNQLDQKVFIGSSMGAFLAAKNYVLSSDAQDSRTVHAGLNLVPINLLCHWDKEALKAEKIKLLTGIDPKTQILKLKEGEWLKINQA